ncbi:MAG TPA: TIGR03435 family protein [Bryobacteraceae bacterium]|jgi:uncharacterized protein (TIGR03435 family)|nr:TIGR03435 family protein [Bryobacteraceae bacterium]
MKTPSVIAIVSLALAPSIFGQSSEPKPAFEAAEIRATAITNNNQGFNGPAIRRGIYQLRYATMVDLVAAAWGVDGEKVIGGPAWLEYDTFEVFARPPAGTTVETAKPMLQALLADRFKLVTHSDTRGLPAFALKAGKRGNMKQSDGSGPSGCTFVPPTAAPAPGEPLLLTYNCRNITMAAFADGLRNFAAVATLYLSGRGVVDQTGLKGAWDFDLQYTPRNMGGGAGSIASITLADTLEKAGLRLEATTAPVPVVVIDGVNQKPTPNAPNVAELLRMPPPPTEFEVAEIKPTDPDYKGTRLQVLPGGRVNVAGAPMKLMIEQIWGIQDDMIAGAPKWTETERFDIVAKAPGSEADIDTDDLIAMLKALLIERFGIQMHTEERPANAYTLTAVKPKMKKADPNTRTKWKEGPPPDGRDPRDKTPALSRLVTVQNMTMAQFAEKLQRIASGYIHSPVLDATGLEGGYDFTLNFSPVGLTRTQGPGRGGGPEGASSTAGDGASDPNGAVSLFEAIDRQLGLRLQAQRRPVQMLVIDHIDEKPRDN